MMAPLNSDMARTKTALTSAKSAMPGTARRTPPERPPGTIGSRYALTSRDGLPAGLSASRALCPANSTLGNPEPPATREGQVKLAVRDDQVGRRQPLLELCRAEVGGGGIVGGKPLSEKVNAPLLKLRFHRKHVGQFQVDVAD